MLNLALFELCTEPLLQPIEQGFALSLVEAQALVRGEAALLSEGMLRHTCATVSRRGDLVWERAFDVDELAPHGRCI